MLKEILTPAWLWYLRPKNLWWKLTLSRYNEGVTRGHISAYRTLKVSLKGYRKIAKTRGEEHLAGYDAATRLALKQFDWISNVKR